MATSMAFTRAFSMKRDKPAMEISTPAYVPRAASNRNTKSIMRTQISSPMALEWTSNVHVQTAHAIAGTVPIEIRKISSSSVHSTSSDESDVSCDSAGSEATITDASSVDEAPSPVSPEAKTKRFSYGKPTVVNIKRSSQPPLSPVSPVSPIDPDATPTIPQRSPSRSQQNHERSYQQQPPHRVLPASTHSDMVQTQTDISGSRSIVQQSTSRSLQLASSYSSARSSYDTIGHRPRTAAAVVSPLDKTSPTTILESPFESPFGQELAQLYEVAQQFGQTTRTVEEDSDVIHMEKHGLAAFSASDYMLEIQSLVHNMFADEQPFFRHLGGFF